MNRTRSIAAIVGVVLTSLLAVRIAGSGEDSDPLYIADPADCIVGLDEPRRLTNPARLDYPRVLAHTPPVREMRRKNIHPSSAEGTVLRVAGERQVAEICASLMGELGHDSVWKRIARRDGVAVPDLTLLALLHLPPIEASTAAASVTPSD